VNPGQSAAHLDEPWHHGLVTANGIRFHVVEAGEGPLLLLLHGFPEFWYSWRHQIPDLSRRFHVVVPDLRGYGETDKPRTGYDVKDLVADTVALAGAFGADRFSLAGHDWGGIIAWATAARHPEQVERLSILNAPHPTLMARALRTSFAQLRRSWYIFAFQLRGIAERHLRANDFAWMEQSICGELVHPERFTAQDLQQFKTAFARPGVVEAALEYYRRAVRGALRDRMFVHEIPIHVPTQVIWGERDNYLGVELLDGLERLVPDLRVDRIATASHWVQQDEPELVTDLLIDFLDRGHSGN
jgi:pimeloyl-ACP methyl ester carboxylesterase